MNAFKYLAVIALFAISFSSIAQAEDNVQGGNAQASEEDQAPQTDQPLDRDALAAALAAAAAMNDEDDKKADKPASTDGGHISAKEEPVAEGGSFTVSSIDTCLSKLSKEDAADVQSNYSKPYSECMRRLAGEAQGKNSLDVSKSGNKQQSGSNSTYVPVPIYNTSSYSNAPVLAPVAPDLNSHTYTTPYASSGANAASSSKASSSSSGMTINGRP